MLVGETGRYCKLVSPVTPTYEGLNASCNHCAPFCSGLVWLTPLCLVLALDAGGFQAGISYLWLLFVWEKYLKD